MEDHNQGIDNQEEEILNLQEESKVANSSPEIFQKKGNKTLKTILVFVILIVLIFTGYMFFGKQKKLEKNTDNEKVENQTKTLVENTSVFSLEEVFTHSTEKDCWLVINEKVYDVTKFVVGHPGGKALLEGCGKDATELFNMRPMGSKTPHSQRANNLLERYYIGDLKK